MNSQSFTSGPYSSSPSCGNSTLMTIPKLDDAPWAGQGNGKNTQCTLILAEGDAVKTLAVAGISALPSEESVKWGVFPLRGKLPNVRDAPSRMLETEEIRNLMAIMGLKLRAQYKNADGLRYGHVMIMSDRDSDGRHIAGLIINFFHHLWPALLTAPGFLQLFAAPIVRAIPIVPQQEAKTDGVVVIEFMTNSQFYDWNRKKNDHQEVAPAHHQYRVQHCQCLGTLCCDDFRVFFKNIHNYLLEFQYSGDQCDQAIARVFDRKCVDGRKAGILNFEEAEFDYAQKTATIGEFFDKEVLSFSITDCKRALPSVVDGFTPSQRKVLYSCFKRKLVAEDISQTTVAQLAGYVSEHALFRHGEFSLQATIVAMSQDFVGWHNNIPLLANSNGQFGTRLMGGRDSASPQSLFTGLHPLTRAIFHEDDDPLLDYQCDGGVSIEPTFYVPIIPMALVNGTNGIGTCFSTAVPSFSPMDAIANIRRLLADEDLQPMTPWYHGFTGTITPNSKEASSSSSETFVTSGNLNIDGKSRMIQITELPVGTWTSSLQKKLRDMKQKGLIISDLWDRSSEVIVDLSFVLHPEVHEEWVVKNPGMLEDKLGLKDILSTANMMFFSSKQKLSKYATPELVLQEFAQVRLDYYQKRKDYLVAKMRREKDILENKLRFISAVVKGELGIFNKQRKELVEYLRANEFMAVSTERIESIDSRSKLLYGGENSYQYLLDVPIFSFTEETANSMTEELTALTCRLNCQLEISINAMWLDDLSNLETKLKAHYEANGLKRNETQNVSAQVVVSF